jgi:hypothetical protein
VLCIETLVSTRVAEFAAGAQNARGPRCSVATHFAHDSGYDDRRVSPIHHANYKVTLKKKTNIDIRIDRLFLPSLLCDDVTTSGMGEIKKSICLTTTTTTTKLV